MALIDQLKFEALELGQQLYQLCLAANPSFTMTQSHFEALEPSQQLYQLLGAIQTGGGGGGGGGGDVTGTNYRIISGVLQEKNASTGLWQTVLPTGAANAETIEFGAQGA